jgi:hypothetical protein
MLHAAAKLFGSILLKWKVRRDRRFKGLYLGPPPKLIGASDLEVGDVIFCAGGLGKTSRVIQAISTDKYTHCALHIGNAALVEVVPKGIQLVTFKQLLSRYDYVSVTRCHGTKGNKNRQRKIRNFARKALAGRVKGYNYIAAALAPFRELSDLRGQDRLWMKKISATISDLRKSKHMFCVQFIIEAFVSCGYIRPDDPYAQPMNRTPTGLAEDNMLEFIGYASTGGWANVSQEDLFLAGNGWVITEAGRAHLQQQEDAMDDSIKKLPKTLADLH